MAWCREVVGLVRWRHERGREEMLGETKRKGV